MIAVPTGAERVVIHPAGWSKSPSPYSYAIRTGDTVFLSGLVSRNGRDNAVVTGDINAQTTVVLDNAVELLKAAGMTMENVVSSRIYLPDGASFQPMNAIYRKYFASAPPARATVVAGLAGKDYVVEITLVASSSPKRVIDDGRPANPNLSAAIRAGDRVYLSGMLGNTAETKGDVGSTDARDAGAHPPRARRGGLLAGRRRRRRGLPDGHHELQRDERRLPRVLRARFSRARNGADRARRRRRAGRDHGHRGMSPQMSVATLPLGLEVFDAAWRHVAPHTHRTPLLSSRMLSERTGFNVRLKAEMFQRTGSYKIRGPLNKFMSLVRGGAPRVASCAPRPAITRRASRSPPASTASRPSS